MREDDASLPLLVLRQIDETCARFEEAWIAGRHPRIEDYLGQAQGLERSRLLEELLRVEVACRRGSGEKPQAEEYGKRFPDDVQLIDLILGEAEVGGRPRREALNRTDSAAAGEATGPPEPPLRRGVGHQREEAPAGGPPGNVDETLPGGKPEGSGGMPGSSLGPTPAKFGRYLVRGELGLGAFGTVYEAYDDQLKRPVAIKVPHDKWLDDEEAVATFLREARHAARLKHPGLVTVYDFGHQRGRCYIVYEFIEGETLEERLKRGRLEHREAALLVADVADALHYAHLHGLIHRDVKPANIMLDQGGRPHVTDFGLAVWYEELAKERQRPAGTPSYMSPEQVRGDADRTDSRSDVYSLGVVLYELLCGRRPFAGDSRDELFEQIEHREARPPRTIDDAVPRDLERICLKAISKQIGDRYTTGRDVAEELRAWEAADRMAAGGADRKDAAGESGAAPTFGLRVVGTPYVYHPPGDVATVTIGRKRRKAWEPLERGNDFIVRVPQSDRQTLRISRRHFEIHTSGEHWSIVDRSKGGTLLNGQRLVKDRPARIRPGDRISVAGVVELEILGSSGYLGKPAGREVSVPSQAAGGGRLVLEVSMGDLTTVETDDGGD